MFKTSNNQNLKSFTKQALCLVFEINDVNALFKKNDYNYELSEGDILGIQNSLLSRNYNFGPLCLVRGSNSTLMLDIKASVANELVISCRTCPLFFACFSSVYDFTCLP